MYTHINKHITISVIVTETQCKNYLFQVIHCKSCGGAEKISGIAFSFYQFFQRNKYEKSTHK